jgi:cardiolipin synthase
LPVAPGKVTAALVLRDENGHHQDIEHAYRLGILSARRDITIACAYFFPGFRLLRALRRAARRGVSVRLILQGRPDLIVGGWAAQALHAYLLRGGVRIFEYRERPLHAKVAVIDDDWSTVGSSNLDPLSLFLNLEANIAVADQGFTAELRASLERLIREHCREVPGEEGRRPGLFRQFLGVLAFHMLRRQPWLAGWSPAHGGPRPPAAGTLAAKEPAA